MSLLERTGWMVAALSLLLATPLACSAEVHRGGAGGAGVTSGSSVSASGTGGTGSATSASSGAGGSCAAGLADCNLDVTDGCETHTATDAENCGACGHDCLGGACVAGACQPLVLASGQVSPSFLAVDAVSVYWTNFGYSNTGAVMKVAKTGGAPTVLASGQMKSRAIAVDGANVYWANAGTEAMGVADGGIYSVPIDGGQTVTLATGQADPALLALDAENVYWTTYYGGTVMKSPKVGGGAAPLVSGLERPVAIALDDQMLYWSTTASFNDGKVMAMPLAGGAPTTLATGEHDPTYLAVDAKSLYWLTSLELRRRPLGGSAPVDTLAPMPGVPTAVVLDGPVAYFTAGFDKPDGVVAKVPVSGGATVTLATGQNKVAGLAQDATALYWCNQGDGTIMKLAK